MGKVLNQFRLNLVSMMVWDPVSNTHTTFNPQIPAGTLYKAKLNEQLVNYKTHLIFPNGRRCEANRLLANRTLHNPAQAIHP